MQELSGKNVSDIPRGNILGVGVHAINMEQTLNSVDRWITEKNPHYICLTPAHSIMSCLRDPILRGIVNQSGLTTPDGMAIVWLLRWQGFNHVERVYGPDLMIAVCQQSIKHAYRHYFFGGAPGVVEKLVKRLHEQYPDLNIVGLESPPFRPMTPEEDQKTIERIQAARADIVWVGIGSPRQELWMNEHLKQLGVPVLVGVGAAFDFLSGNKPQAPRWMQRSGLEWLFRLMSEPRRLWKRYLDYPKFLMLVFLQKMGLKQYPIN